MPDPKVTPEGREPREPTEDELRAVREGWRGFAECVRQCLDSPSFIEEWARLRGFKVNRAPIEQMIDEATGYGDHVARQFLSDVWDTVWIRLPENVRAELGIEAR